MSTQDSSGSLVGLGAVGNALSMTAFDVNRDTRADLLVTTQYGGVIFFDPTKLVAKFGSSLDGGQTSLTRSDIVITDSNGSPQIGWVAGSFLRGGSLLDEDFLHTGGGLYSNDFGMKDFSSACSLNGTDLVIAGEMQNNPRIVQFVILSQGNTINHFGISNITLGDLIKDETDPTSNRIIISFQLKDHGSEYFIASIDTKTGSEIWRSRALDGIVSRKSMRFVDVNADGKLKLVYGTSRSMNITR